MQDIFDFKQYKTPVVPILDERNEIYVKRDDLLPFSFGGNKVRIALEFIDDMKKQGDDCIVGYGGARSNLSRALANLCYRFNIPCHIILPVDRDATRIDTFNSKLVLACDAELDYCPKTNVKETVERVIKELNNKGMKPYYIYGDSTGMGNEHTPLKAYIKVYEEIKNQYDYIFLATGTGMTQGGLLAGKAINNGHEMIVGISVSRSSVQEKEVLKTSLDHFSEKVRRISDCEINVVDEYLCEGYGMYNRSIEKTIYHQFTQNGMPLDPTYTGKAFWGMQDYLEKHDIKGKRILFIHTGGMPLFFDFIKEIKLVNISNRNDTIKAIKMLESNLIPSLSERKVDLVTYAEKLHDYGKVWCHYDMGKPVSITAGYFNDEVARTAYLSILAVDTKYRGKKLASSLLMGFETYAIQNKMEYIKLEVRKNNNAAQQFYKKYGYEVICEATDTSLYMIKHLRNSINTVATREK